MDPMKAFCGMLGILLGLVFGACGEGRQSKSVPALRDSGENLAERAAARRLIEGFFGDHHERQKHRYGAFFILVDPQWESGFRQFMIGHMPRVEVGSRNLVELGRRTYQDAITGLPSIVLRLEPKSISDDEAIIEVWTEASGGFVF